MDPDAVVERYLDAFEAQDREEMQEAADDYNSWIARGGFPATLTDGRGIWGLSGNWNEGEPASPVGDGNDSDDFVRASELMTLWRE